MTDRSKHAFLRAALFGIVGGALSAGTVVAQASSSVPNWTVPAYHRSSASGGLTTMADVTPGIAFVGMTPCRIVDTRDPAGPYGGPSLAAGISRDFDLNNGPCTQIPSGVEAYSLNLTVTNTAGPGFIKIYPQGGVEPAVSTLNYQAGDTLANAAIVPAGAAGGVTVVAGVSGTNLIIDINGYFTESFENNNTFVVSVNSTTPAIDVDNISTTCNSEPYSGCGVQIEVEGGNALFAASQEGTGQNSGVIAFTSSTSDASAGVRGEPASDHCGLPSSPVGVLGLGGEAAAGEVPVLGMGDFAGVEGINTIGCAAAQSVASFGVLGYSDTTAVFASGDMAATGVKPVVDPHPTDASKVIKYVGLEGPEAGTYFRGRGRFQRGIASIDVPEDFRLITDTEGLSIQVTPIGQMATVAVESIGLDRIVVRGSRNVEFFYTVNGVRRTFKNWKPIQESGEFAAGSENAKMVGAWSAEQKRLLVQNGSYNVDGTVNKETARRLGWDKAWEGKRPQPQSKRNRKGSAR